MAIHKVCPVVFRQKHVSRGHEVLAFEHPTAGCQLVKGTIKKGERPEDAARRELLEESGIRTDKRFIFLGHSPDIAQGQLWSFYQISFQELPAQRI